MDVAVRALSAGILHFFVYGDLFAHGILVELLAPIFTKTLLPHTGLVLDNASEPLSLTQSAAIALTQVGIFFLMQAVVGLVRRCSRENDSCANSLLLLTGVLVWFGGMYGSSATSTYTAFFPVYALLTGIGGGIVYWTTWLAICDNHWAVFFVVTCQGAGVLVHVYVFSQYFTLDVRKSVFDGGYFVFAWQETLRYFAVIGGSVMLAAALAFLCTPECKKVEVAPDKVEDEEKGEVKAAAANETPAGCCNASYVLFVCSQLCSGLTMMIPMVYFPSYLASLTPAISRTEIGYIMMAGAGVGLGVRMLIVFSFAVATCSCPKQLPTPPVKESTASYALYVIASIASFALLFSWIGVVNATGAYVVICFFGATWGASSLTTSLMVNQMAKGEFVGEPINKDTLTTIMGVVTGPPIVLSGMLFSVIQGAIGYTSTIAIVGSIQAMGAIFALFILKSSKDPKDKEE